jgi:hypothetical protein
MVMVEIDSNAILLEPMKNRKDAKMIRAYNALLLQLKWAGIVPKKYVLDNEVSENIKNHIRESCKLDMGHQAATDATQPRLPYATSKPISSAS